MAASVKVKATVLVAFLSMFLASNSFAVTGGLDYFLGIFNTPPAQTRATLTSVQNMPRTETHVPLETWDIPAQGVLDLRLGRIEYEVGINNRKSYTTIFFISVTDNALGATDCTFIFHVNVKDEPGGPVADIAEATANGVDSAVFARGPGTSNKRCQVFPSAGRGPSMYIYSRSQFVP